MSAVAWCAAPKALRLPQSDSDIVRSIAARIIQLIYGSAEEQLHEGEDALHQ